MEDDVAMLAWVCVDTCTLNKAVKLNSNIVFSEFLGAVGVA